MPEADPAKGVVDRRQRGDHTEAALELALQLGERGIGGSLDPSSEVRLVGFGAWAATP
jgi:hypothetical protein